MQPRPITTGIGLRSPHIAEIAAHRPSVGFLEVHSENYFGGGAKLKVLEGLRADYPLSLHGVGLSLGRADGLDRDHLRKLKALVDRFDPFLVSEHLSWSAYSHVAVPDLLPLPLTREAFEIFAQHVDAFQQVIGRQVLIENPSNYVAFDRLDYDEPEFLLRLAERTGCGILLDINNIYVSAHNLKRDPQAYVERFDGAKSVQEFHLAGHQVAGDLLIDTHGARVPQPVWSLYAEAVERIGHRPTLIEWDSDIPPLEVLLDEAATADRYLHKARDRSPAHV
ncbi:MAG: DUF692 domain-containing protein [Asticcacaulis sp.]|nr:DUF692 domain-containing protein [Asticcacaulis sp.]